MPRFAQPRPRWRSDLLRALARLTGHVVNNPSVSISFPEDNSSIPTRPHNATIVTLQNLNGSGAGLPSRLYHVPSAVRRDQQQVPKPLVIIDIVMAWSLTSLPTPTISTSFLCRFVYPSSFRAPTTSVLKHLQGMRVPSRMTVFILRPRAMHASILGGVLVGQYVSSIIYRHLVLASRFLARRARYPVLNGLGSMFVK